MRTPIVFASLVLVACGSSTPNASPPPAAITPAPTASSDAPSPSDTSSAPSTSAPTTATTDAPPASGSCPPMQPADGSDCAFGGSCEYSGSGGLLSSKSAFEGQTTSCSCVDKSVLCRKGRVLKE